MSCNACCRFRIYPHNQEHAVKSNGEFGHVRARSTTPRKSSYTYNPIDSRISQAVSISWFPRDVSQPIFHILPWGGSPQRRPQVQSDAFTKQLLMDLLLLLPSRRPAQLKFHVHLRCQFLSRSCGQRRRTARCRRLHQCTSACIRRLIARVMYGTL